MVELSYEFPSYQVNCPKLLYLPLLYVPCYKISYYTLHFVQVEGEGCSVGSRYVNNLLEFNRKMSVYSRPAALLPVEVQRKPSGTPLERA